MRQTLRRGFVHSTAAAVAGLLVICMPSAFARAQTRALTGPQVGQPAPAFALTTLDGKSVTLQSYAGKTLVINVWATWCPPCRSETPDLIASYRRLQAKNVVFLGIDSTEEAPIVRAFVAAKGVPYPQAIDTGRRFDRAYDIQYFPTTLVIDARGTLRARYIDVITPAVLGRLARSAAQGRNAAFTSLFQNRIDALLGVPMPASSATLAAKFAAADKVRRVIERAEELLDASDPAGGKTVDLLRTRAEEAVVRDRAIALLSTPAVADPRSAALRARLRGDAASDREVWYDALVAYRQARALDPNNVAVLQGIAFVAGRLGRFDDAIDADKRLAALQPEDVSAFVALALTEAKASKFSLAYRTFQRAIALGSARVRARPHNALALRLLAWAHLYAGRTYAKGAQRSRARREFAEVSALALELPKGDERRDMYLEEAQEALVALDLAGGATTSIVVSPWTGADLPGSIAGTIKYRLMVTGVGGHPLALSARGLPRGWVASFCTDRLCAPFHVVVLLPESGVKLLEFQLVPDHGAAAPPHVIIEATDRQARGTAEAAT